MDGMGAVWRGARRLAERTPPSRERFIDLLRAISIIAVVLGHWLAAVVGYDRHGELTGESALPFLPWAQPLTWVVQVMPVFFFVGGYANAVSLTAERRRGGSAAEWVLGRSGHLVPPTTALVLVLAGGAVAAGLFGAEPVRVRTVVWLAAIPLWFLVAYLVVVVLTPPMYALHRRYGLAVPLVLAGLVALGDLARLSGAATWGNGNFVFGWLAVHQMGFAWRDGRLPARPRVALPLLFGGAGAVLLLTLAGPYPVSMINVPGERLHNMSPPSLALLAVATAQIGAALLLRDRAERWLRRRGPWTVVVAVNTVIVTVFLWHICAAIVMAGALHAAGVLPTPTVGTAAWLAWRVPWLILCVLALAPLVALFGPIEVRGVRRRLRPAPAGTARVPAHRPAVRMTAYRAATRARENQAVARMTERWSAARVTACRAVSHVTAPPAARLTLAVLGLACVAGALFANSLFPGTAPAPYGFPAAALIAYLLGAAVLRLLRATSPARRRDDAEARKAEEC